MNRISFLDSLRGFAIFLIVVRHVFTNAFLIESIDTGLWNILIGPSVPLFFFISGFFANRMFREYDLAIFSKRLLKKAPVFLVAPLVFLYILSLLRYQSFIEMLFDLYKSGYWFTISLFEFLAVYGFFMLLCAKISFLKERKSLSIVLLAVLSNLAFLLLDQPFYSLSKDAYLLSGFHFFGRINYLLLGALIGCYQKQADKLLSDRRVSAAIVALFFLTNVYNHAFTGSIVNYCYHLFEIAVQIIVFYMLFNSVKWLSDNSTIGRTLIFMGRRTLDIYFLHYFFILYGLSFITAIFNPAEFSLLYFIAAILIAVPITGLALATGRIIRLSPWLGKYLLGANNRQ